MNEKYTSLNRSYAAGASAGFLLAIVLMAGIRERIEISRTIQGALRGLPIALVTAGLMSCFMGFSGYQIGGEMILNWNEYIRQ